MRLKRSGNLPKSVPILRLTLALAVCFLTVGSVSAEENSGSNKASFGPTWKLLSADQKRQFIAGYLHAWQDARKVTEALKDFSRQKPEELTQSFEKILSLYDIAHFSPDGLVRDLDRVFSDPETRDATLAEAVSQVRASAGAGPQ